MSRRSKARYDRRSYLGRNFVALLVLAAAAGVVQMNVQPEPVQAVTDEAAANAGFNQFGSSTSWTSLSSAVEAASSEEPVPYPADHAEPTQSEHARANASELAVNETQAKLPAAGTESTGPVATSEKASVAEPEGASEQPSRISEQARSSSNVLTGRMALLVNLLMLEKSEQILKQVPDYTATFKKQERINGKLTDLQVMSIKVRHHPFSIYMKWLSGNRGRQVLYVEGQNNNKMLVKFGGWKSRLPALKIDPNSALALAESRYPITKAGMLQIVQEIIPYRRRDLQHADKVHCVLRADVEFEGRPCYACIVEYTDPKYSPTYRKSILLLDQESFLPVAVKNFTWPEMVDDVDPKNIDDSTLLEYYAFTNVRLNAQLADSDFDRSNKAYRF